MNHASTYAFYGSLRRGMDNHEVYAAGLRYLFSAWICGFKLYSRGEYPCVTQTGINDDRVMVEVFEITDVVTEEGIHQLELEEGYDLKQIEIDGRTVGIYLYQSVENYQEVPEGDWVDFYRKRQKM